MLWTAAGPLWADWEDAFAAPREWDAACLLTAARLAGEDDPAGAEAALAAAGLDADPARLELMLEARALLHVAWAAVLGDDPAPPGRAVEEYDRLVAG